MKSNASPTDFTTNIIQTGVNHTESMTALDFDSDGDLDIVSGRSTNRISIWENTGSLNFTRHDIYDNNYNFIYEPKAVYPIDMDNQNGKDIIIANKQYGGWAATQGNSDRVSIYFNDGSSLRIVCTDWGKEFEADRYHDNIDVGLSSSKMNNWLYDEAYQ